MAVPIALCERSPQVTPEQLLATLVPPPTFADARLESYRPDPAEPSQREARAAVERFAASLTGPRAGEGGTFSSRGRRLPWLPRRPAGSSEGSFMSPGLYLDGGFGVGKTHLLAGLWHRAPEPRLFATFVELTSLVGALGFAQAVERLATYTLVCIDEFELDDPGDTVLISTLLRRLADRGVRLAATSNTLPGRLGEGRFAAADFLREIQSLSDRFEVVRVGGPDYRSRELGMPPPPYGDDALARLADSRPGASLDHFVDLTRHLAEIHPSRYGALGRRAGLPARRSNPGRPASGA